jgi:hypothetical protein
MLKSVLFKIFWYTILFIGVAFEFWDLSGVFIYFFVELIFKILLASIFYRNIYGQKQPLLILIGSLGISLILFLLLGIFFEIRDGYDFFNDLSLHEGSSGKAKWFFGEYWGVILLQIIGSITTTIITPKEELSSAPFTSLIYSITSIFAIISLSMIFVAISQLKWHGWYALIIISVKIIVDIYLQKLSSDRLNDKLSNKGR